MLETNEYVKKLNEVSSKLQKYFDEISVSENGASSFVNAKKTDLEVEIYRLENSVAVDLWKGEEELNNEELIEKEVGTYEEAISVVIEWLKKYEK